MATGYDGYHAITRPETAHGAQALNENGYSTAWFGKNHNVPTCGGEPQGPFTHFPIGQGYDYFYGFIGGDTSQWQPGNLFRNTTPIHPYEGKPGWNLISAMADDAIEYISTQTATDPKRPWLIHYAPGATHAPHHPTPEWIEKISAMHLFDDGWNAVSERIFANQKKLGVIPANAQAPALARLPAQVGDADGRREEALSCARSTSGPPIWPMSTTRSDASIETVEKLGLLDNTLIIFVCGDNGMSAEGSMHGTPNEVAYLQRFRLHRRSDAAADPRVGHRQDLPALRRAVGVCNGYALQVDEADRLASRRHAHRHGCHMAEAHHGRGGIRHQFHHVIDVMPTIFEAIGIPQPTMVNGMAQVPWDGTSMVYSFDKASAEAPTTRTTQYFEIFGNRAIYHEGWMASTIPAVYPWEGVKGSPPVDVLNGFKWELFNLKEDPTQTNDLAAQEPERLQQLQQLWMIEAVRNNVLPLNASQVAVLTVQRPGPAAGRKQFVYTTPNASNQFAVAPSILNRSYTITAEIEVPEGGANGVLVTQGGRFSGYGLYLKDGKPTFTMNLLDIERPKWHSSDALPPGKHSIVFDWKMDPAGMPVGRGGTGTLTVNGKQVATKSLPRTQPFIWAWDETFDVGLDTGTSVDESDYQAPFPFTGKLEKVTFDLGDTSMTPEAIKAMMEELAKKRDR